VSMMWRAILLDPHQMRVDDVVGNVSSSLIKGRDVLTRAKTGSGKTVGFVLPAIEVLMKAAGGSKSRPGKISCLVGPGRCCSPRRPTDFNLNQLV